jgi:hypothetical protein
MMMEEEEVDADDAPASDFDMYADEFLDESLPAEDRRAALKAAIMTCMDTDYAPESEKDGKPKEDGGLALIFGGGSKK